MKKNKVEDSVTADDVHAISNDQGNYIYLMLYF